MRGARSDRGDARLRAENKRLLAENARLRSQLEAARRAGKRQAAPFSKGESKKDPQRPGRKSGEDYGTKAHRPIPDHVDEEIWVPLPDACPCCEGELELEDEVDQYQEDVARVRGHVRHFGSAAGAAGAVAGAHRAATPMRPRTRSGPRDRRSGPGRSRSPRS